MKVLKCIVAVFLATGLSVAVCAQETKTDENRDENGKIVRGPYVTNGFGANWFVGAAGGVNLFMNGSLGYAGKPAGALDVYFGKWFMPDLGVRIGYKGLMGRQDGAEFIGSDTEGSTVEEFCFFYLHADVMWNLTNTIAGYKESRVWHAIPYAHFGAQRIWDRVNTVVVDDHRVNEYDNEVAFGVGLYNTFRLSKRAYATIDVRETMFSPRYHGVVGTSDLGNIASNLSITAGLGFYLGKVGWDRADKCNGGNAVAQTAALAASLAAAEAALAEAKEANQALTEKVDSIKQADSKQGMLYINDTTYVAIKMGVAPCTLFFEKNSPHLNSTERHHLDFYVNNIIHQDPEHVFYLTGTADAATGNDAINTRLSRQRVENVKKIIMQEYGIPSERLIIKGANITSKYSDPRLDRSVIIEH